MILENKAICHVLTLLREGYFHSPCLTPLLPQETLNYIIICLNSAFSVIVN